MDWKELKDSKDVSALLETFGHFHDGCIKELKYISGEYADEHLSMMPLNALRKLSVIFQRQFSNPSAIEIVFEGLRKMHLAPSYGNRDGIISGVSMGVTSGIVYWSDCESFDVFDVSQMNYASEYNEYTWMISEKAKWRNADEYIGNDEVYISKNNIQFI